MNIVNNVILSETKDLEILHFVQNDKKGGVQNDKGEGVQNDGQRLEKLRVFAFILKT